MFHSIADKSPAKRALNLLKIFVLVAEAIIIGRLLYSEDLTWLPFMLVGIGSLALLITKWPYGALLALIGASAMPRYYVEIFGWKARPEHFAVALIVLVASAKLLLRKPQTRLVVLDYLVIAYVAVNYLSSGLMSPEPPITLRWALLNNLVVIPYFFFRFFAPEKHIRRRAFQILLGVGSIEAIYGIICFTSHVLFGTGLGIEPEQYGYIPGTYGSQYEANIFGSYTGCCAVMFLTLYLLDRRHPRRYLLGFAIASTAMIVSLARAALLGFAIAVVFVLYLGHRNQQLRFSRLARPFVAFGVFLLIFIPLVGAFLSARISTLSVGEPQEDKTVAGRLLAIAVSLEDIKQHPLLGNGTASLQLLADQRENPELGDRPWVGNAPLRMLHDTGLLGLAFFLIFVVWLVALVRHGLKAESQEGPMLAALLSGGLVYVVAFQATDATMLSFTWVHLGLMSSVASFLEITTAQTQTSLRVAA